MKIAAGIAVFLLLSLAAGLFVGETLADALALSALIDILFLAVGFVWFITGEDFGRPQ